MRMGIFGGSFDPIHLGHLWIAEAALESLALDQVRWMPAAQSPLKARRPIAADDDRLQMIRLAISGCEEFVVDDREIQRGEISYTVDTIAELQSLFPEAELFMIIGSDSLATMRKWHQAERLLRMVIPAVVQRGGEREIDFSVLDGLVDEERIQLFRRHIIAMPIIELSSSELRKRVDQGQSIRFKTPRAVEAMIQAGRIYKPSRSRDVQRPPERD